MFEKDCYNLGYILKYHGFRGDLKVKTNLNISEDICKKWESMFFRIDGILVPFFVENIVILDSESLLIKFEDIDDDTFNYKEIQLFIDKKMYQEVPEKYKLDSCINCEVIVQGNLLGIVSNVLDYPAQKMFEVTTNNSTTYLIPMNREWIVEMNTNNHQIIMDLPEGLLTLND